MMSGGGQISDNPTRSLVLNLNLITCMSLFIVHVTCDGRYIYIYM